MKRVYEQKEKRLNKLSKDQQRDLVYDLVNAIIQAQSLEDAALFLQDILTKKEMQNLSKRLRIAKFLIAGKTYEEIKKFLHVSHGTVAKIAVWLADRGDGFRKIIQKLPQKKNVEGFKEFSDWDKYKRSHSLYFWPELLLEEVIKSAKKNQKDRIADVLDKLKEKSELHKRIEKLLKYSTT